MYARSVCWSHFARHQFLTKTMSQTSISVFFKPRKVGEQAECLVPSKQDDSNNSPKSVLNDAQFDGPDYLRNEAPAEG